jgi:transposase-like protein
MRTPTVEQLAMITTLRKANSKMGYCYRAIDQEGQVMDAYFSTRRNAAVARTFFERAIAGTGAVPECIVTDRAACYPPAVRAVLPGTEHRCSKYLNNGLERDHGHLEQRLRPMRGFKHPACADTVVRGHALVQNLRNGFSTLTAPVERRLRLLWPRGRSWRG